VIHLGSERNVDSQVTTTRAILASYAPTHAGRRADSEKELP
jgi:hypothetical protein